MKKQIWYIDRDERIADVVRAESPNISSVYDVLVITNPIVIDEKLRERLPELIFIDSVVALQDEASIIKGLRGSNETKAIPILLLGTDVRTEDVAKEIGADDFLRKPFDMRQFFEKVEGFQEQRSKKGLMKE